MDAARDSLRAWTAGQAPAKGRTLGGQGEDRNDCFLLCLFAAGMRSRFARGRTSAPRGDGGHGQSIAPAAVRALCCPGCVACRQASGALGCRRPLRLGLLARRSWGPACGPCRLVRRDRGSRRHLSRRRCAFCSEVRLLLRQGHGHRCGWLCRAGHIGLLQIRGFTGTRCCCCTARRHAALFVAPWPPPVGCPCAAVPTSARIGGSWRQPCAKSRVCTGRHRSASQRWLPARHAGSARVPRSSPTHGSRRDSTSVDGGAPVCAQSH